MALRYANFVLPLQAAFGDFQYAAISYTKQGISYKWTDKKKEVYLKNYKFADKK